MKKTYETPDLEYVSLIADEAITNDFFDGDAGVEDVPSGFEW